VAAKAEMSQSHVAKIEAPHGGLPTLTTLKKYGKACGRDVLHLEFLTSDEFAHRRGSIDKSDPTGSALDLVRPEQSAPAKSDREDRCEAAEGVSEESEHASGGEKMLQHRKDNKADAATAKDADLDGAYLI